MKVYKAIAAVTADLAKDGIAKDRKNQQQNYSFRGIDDVYNALSPVLAKHGLCILPRVLSRETVERQTSKGTPLFFTTVDVEFDFVAAEDGSSHTVRTIGEAMDMADKSSNKAMSAAYKYAAMQAFCIPTEGDNDADATTHEVAPSAAKPQPSKARQEKPASSSSDNPFADEAVDWKQEGRDLAELVKRQATPNALDDLWNTARVKAFRQGAGEPLVLAFRAVFVERKRALMPAQEVA